MSAKRSPFEAVELGQRVAKEDYEAALPELRVGLVNAQYDLRQADFAVLLLVAGNDRLSVRDLLNEMNEWMDARYVRRRFFGALTEEEHERPRAWRYWNVMPRDGETAILVGAWAAVAIGERADGELDAQDFERRCELIRRLENSLVADGTLLIKLWLHLPKKEMKKRLEKSKKQPHKSWQVDKRDWASYEGYDDTAPIAEELVRETSTGEAPWTVIDSTDRHFVNLTVARMILAQLTARLAPKSAQSPVTPVLNSSTAVTAPNVGERGVLDTLDLALSLPDDQYEQELERYSARLSHLTQRARRKDVASIIVFEGWDAAGKGGAIRRLTHAIDLEYHRIVPISAPTEEERAHHYLWRFWRELPRDGEVLLFDRSWYGRVLVERVEGFATRAEWSRAYDEINDFEEHLVEHGIVLVKFWLHISHAEQMRRFEQREHTSYKKYKITADDYRNRAKRPQYEAAVTEMVARTSTKIAPWHLVPANDKRWARIRVFETVCAALEERL